ncbi:MAG TPA: 2-C-methyl-D-erythritol 4-phosphate cytidylyltransferase [Thermoleophilia bacterium]|nr:2-C-methyl-D-erythritol 4-phosphate cytidylyltransferase [Thermoleophilia bacterium]
MDDGREGSVWAVVAAAGESRRMGLPEGESKQFLLLGGEPVLCHSVRRLLSIPAVAGVVVVLHPSHTVRFASELLRLDEGKPILIAEGGRERCDSIRAGLLEVPPGTEFVTVHDGARPLFSKHVFEDCLSVLAGPGAIDGAVPACPVADTLKRADADGGVVETVDRSGLWAVQTPQLFRADALRAAYARPGIVAATDDAALLERAGRRVVVVPSTPGNVKITTPSDLPLAGAVLSWEVEADV